MGSLEIWVLILVLPSAYSLSQPQFTLLYYEEVGLFQLRHSVGH